MIDGDASTASFWAILTSGGIPGLLILCVLAGLSVAALYLVIEQWVSLRRSDVVPEKLSDSVAGALQAGRYQDAEALLRSQPSVLAGVVSVGLSHREYGWPEIEKAAEDALVDQAEQMRRKIAYLAMIANLAPMVGLLGTVMGMILAFRQVATSGGAAGAGDLAEGIYQALVTTVGGLIVAIPTLASSGILRSRVDGLLSEATRQAAFALAPLRRRMTTAAATPTHGSGRIVAVPPAKMPPPKP